MGQIIEFPCPDGSTAKGYLASATQADAPGIVVIQEWWGLQDQIKGLCDQFAAAGYHSLAPDLYGGKVVPYHDPAAAGAAMSSLDFTNATDHGVRGAAQYLARHGKKVGLTGFCMGGAVTTIGAVRIPELSAAVTFYGIAPDAEQHAAALRVPLQGHFALHDDWIAPAMVKSYDAALTKAGKMHEFFEYDAQHGFMNEQRPEVFNAEAKKQAWARCMAFFGKYLKG